MFVIHFLKNGEYKNEREHNVLKSLDHEKDFSKVASWGCIRQGQADAQTETAQVAKEQRSADGLRLMFMCHRRTKEPSPDTANSFFKSLKTLSICD